MGVAAWVIMAINVVPASSLRSKSIEKSFIHFLGEFH